VADAPDATPATSGASQWHGVVPLVLQRRPDFQLTDTGNRPYDFAGKTRGRATLLFFGYTNCPDECPTTMADIALALRASNAATKRLVTVVFVTTDPARDDAKRIRQWLDRFDPSFVGLRGTPAEIERAETAAGVPPAQAPISKVGSYLVAHASQVAAYGPDDLNHIRYFARATDEDYRADLSRLVAIR